MKCIGCLVKLTGRQRKFCGSDCKNRVSQSYESQKTKGSRKKRKIIDLLGGKCSQCGYSKSLNALCFHHLDPSQKRIKLDLRTMANNSMNKIIEEAKKCILLCCNCHMELHYGSIGQDGIEPTT